MWKRIWEDRDIEWIGYVTVNGDKYRIKKSIFNEYKQKIKCGEEVQYACHSYWWAKQPNTAPTS